MRTSLSLAAALLFSTILVAPDIAAAAGEANPTPPSQTNQSSPMKMKKVKKKTSSDEDFLKGYHAAYALIYDKGDYVGGIAALRALGYDDNADVATLWATPAASSAAMTTPSSGTSARSPPTRTTR